MNALHRRRWMWSTLGALSVIGIVWILVRPRADQGVPPAGGKVAVSSHSGGGNAPPEPADAGIPLLPDPKTLAHLPPAERINAETKARMERSAAWREKLRNGDYTSLPPEAWPAITPPPLPQPAQ
jgi:hypothetical protein